METDLSAPLLPDDHSVRRAWLRLLIVVIVLICLAGVLLKREPQRPAPPPPVAPVSTPEPLPRAIRCRSPFLPVDDDVSVGCRQPPAVDELLTD